MPSECVFKVIREHQNGNNECGYAGKCAWCNANPDMLTLKYMQNKVKTMEDAWMVCTTYAVPEYILQAERERQKGGRI
jgi:hypothetical protein